MSELEPSGLEMMQQNMAALDSGEDAPHNEEMAVSSEPEPEQEIQSEPEQEIEQPEIEAELQEEEAPADDARHMSKEDWVASGKDADAYLTPDEFKRAGNLRNESQLSLAKKLAQQETMLTEIIKNQNSAIKETERRVREETLDGLKKEQAEAMEFGDIEKSVKLEREMANHEAVEKPVDDKPQVDPTISQWHSQNSDWYNVDPSATGLLNVELQRAQKKGLPFGDAIGPAMEKVKRQFHYLFDDAPAPQSTENKKAVAPRPTSISAKSRTASKPAAKKRSFSELDPSLQVFARRSAKAAGMTEQSYMEQMQ